MPDPEFLIVDVGAGEAKVGDTLTILAVEDSQDKAEKRADDLDTRARYIAILERKGFWRRVQKVDRIAVEKRILEPKKAAPGA